MSRAWEAAVRNTKKLSIFPTQGFTSAAAWGPSIFTKIIDEFNKLSVTNKLGVTLKVSTLAPAPDGNGGADVQIDVSNGSHTFNFFGLRSGSLLPPPNINGKTHSVSQGGEVIRAFIFMPIDPTTEIGGRGVGTGLKVALALHEVLHACGLEETDPGHITGLNTPDLFRTGAQPDFNFPPDGNPGDRLELGFGKFTPPFFLTARTAGLVRTIWQ